MNFFQSLEKKTGSSLDRDSGFDSILSARDDEGGRLTGQLSRMVGGGGKHSPAALGFQVREKMGMEYWPSDKKLPCSDMQLVTWRAVVPWQEIINPPRKEIKKKQKKPQTKHCFLSDQEDVLRGGWSVELEAVQAQVWQTWLGSGCSLVPRVRCYCTADWSE